MKTPRVLIAAALASCMLLPATSRAQQLLDRVVARVGAESITLSDVDAAIGLGLIAVPEGEDARQAALQQLIDRRLQLVEVERFPPREPAPAAIDAEVAAMRARAGSRADEVIASTGLDERRLRDIARDTLRIQAYIAQRFGTSLQVSDAEARRYYTQHPREFTRNGAVVPFEDVEAQARERASADRRRASVEQWVRDLRVRANVVIVKQR